ncbi:delta-1-pyrroline-5-carboxylate dehydrogenase, mitochondrial-like [Mytilus californianus]|uniref:delta-1-pyrroline-5-carboxylate dehydrogenase, mitochondrial-like n=1 Tax=Mytilus californianus TaxID=6549 RepID=UPI00224661B5|nr:delta-1-pyrroline-5-carboxylate dehydrogenase, mitochondrial-like [Mytilus californianus]
MLFKTRIIFSSVKRLCRVPQVTSTAQNRQIQTITAYTAVNEPILSYEDGCEEKEALLKTLDKYSTRTEDVPIVIGDEEFRTSEIKYQVEPFDHKVKIAKYYNATPELIQKAIDNSLKARQAWDRTPLEARCNIFLKAADLMSKEYRMDLMATTMMGQAKNIVQAEIDAVCELIDFLRFNVQYALSLQTQQPLSPSAKETLNSQNLRGMEGFWAAISPFNFTAIGGNLCQSPAMMGNVTVWKPSDTAMLSNYLVYKIYREAGLPPGVINFVPADGPVFGDTVTASKHLAGINFTGSVRTFQHLWKQVANNIENYRTYPRLIGECGGKNFHFVHKSGDLESVVNGTIRSAFEYGGQKCSACSRMYIPQSMWPEVKEKMLKIHKKIKVGSPLDVETFVSAIIDDKSFDRNKAYLDHAKSSPNLKIVAGGNCDNSKGYFVEPTIIETTDPDDKIMKEEIFGPVLTVYPYPDDQYKEVADILKETSPFALTGAIFALDEVVKKELTDKFRDCAGNFYINDKSTGSVVGQQPFGGSRLSGTNDKAGGANYLLRFASIQSVKETFKPLTAWDYPYMN